MRPEHRNAFYDGAHLRVYNQKLGYTHSLCSDVFLSTYDLTVPRPRNEACFHWCAGYGEWLAAENKHEIECQSCAIRHLLIRANKIPIGRPHGLRHLKLLEAGR